MPDLLTYDVIDMTAVKQSFAESGTRRQMKRGECFCRIEQPVREIGLVESGAFAFARADSKGQDQILSMAFEGELVGAVISLHPGRCSAFDVRALCRSELLVMPLDKWIADMEERQPGFYHNLIAAIAYGFMMRGISYRCATPEQRYAELLSRLPNARRLISMSSIASYLGMSREAFSRLRSRKGI